MLKAVKAVLIGHQTISRQRGQTYILSRLSSTNSSPSKYNIANTNDFSIPGFKDLIITAKSLSLIDVAMVGFNLEDIEYTTDIFYERKLRLNKNIPYKKSIKVNENDTVDLISDVTNDVVKIKRLIVFDFSVTTKETFNINIRRWMKPIERRRIN